MYIFSLWNLFPMKLLYKILYNPVVDLNVNTGNNWRYLEDACDEIVTLGWLNR